MPQFFIQKKDINNEEILITNQSDIYHITNVIRLKKGDEIVLVCAQKGVIYSCKIKSVNKELVTTKVIESYKGERKLKNNIVLAQSVLKSHKQSIVIQKAAELGVSEIIPYTSKHTVVKLDDEKDKVSKMQRWQKISYEAAKQCKRTGIARIDKILTLQEVANLKDFDIKLVCSEKKTEHSIKSFLQKFSTENKVNNILVIIGPEGGFSDEEIELLHSNNILSVTLGNLILRAETAALTAIGNIIYEYEL